MSSDRVLGVGGYIHEHDCAARPTSLVVITSSLQSKICFFLKSDKPILVYSSFKHFVWHQSHDNDRGENAVPLLGLSVCLP